MIGYIARSVKSDGPLPANAVGDALLAARVQEAATEKPSPVRSLPEAAKAVSGTVYRFKDNALHLNSISLHLNDADPSYEFEYTGQLTGATDRFVGTIGLNGVYRTSSPTKNGFIPAAKGAWIDERTFVIKRQTLGNDDLQTWLLLFDGNKLDLVSGDAEGPQVVLRGEAHD